MRLKEYNRDKAVAYAHRWAYDRNPAYYDFSNIGGDCTKPVSHISPLFLFAKCFSHC